jgi:hypothetical protein
MDYMISCHTSVLIITDILHYIIPYFDVLMVMYCELNFCHTLQIILTWHVCCNEFDLSNITRVTTRIV